MRVFATSYRLLLSFAFLGSIVWQVTDRIANNVFRPQEYFTFFTIDTSILAGLLMLVAATYSWRGAKEPLWFSRARLGVVTASVIVAVVYNALLRGLPPAAADMGYEWPTVPNDILHIWAPLFLVVEWLIFAPNKTLKWQAAFWAWAYPFAWLAFTLVRGAVDGWWPYFFIDPTDKGGVPGMLTYIFGIMAFMFIVASALLPLQRVSQRLVATK